MKTIRYIDKPNNIFKKEKFILSALNLAFLSYYFDKIYLVQQCYSSLFLIVLIVLS